MSKPTLNWFDRFLLSVAPGYGMRRLQARSAAFAYEAGSGGRRTSGWSRSSSDANTAAGPSIVALRELSRDLRRNNSWAQRGIQVISGNTVGWGITPRPTGVRGTRAETALAMWNDWAESTACDHDGRLPFAGLQRLVMETVVESGEALIIRQPGTADQPFPLRVQVLEPDYLSAAQDGIVTQNDGVIIQGVEFDSHNQRVAYWLYPRHPGSALAAPVKRGLAARRVPAEDVIHVYRVNRPGQARGVPWLASAIARLNDFDDFEDAELMQKKVAACFAAFVTDIEANPTAVGAQDPIDAELESLEPGHISYLSPGKDVKFAQPQGSVDSGFSVRNLRRIAAGLGVTYEDMTGDYSQVNFSSARMARLSHGTNINDWRFNMLIPQMCGGVWRWAMQLAAGLGNWTQVPGAQWTPPPMPMLEPDKEALAYQRAIRIGAMTQNEMIRERGYDPAAQLAEIAETNAELDKKKIILDSDPRHTTAAGQLQGAAAPAKPPADDGAGGGTKPDDKKPPGDGE